MFSSHTIAKLQYITVTRYLTANSSGKNADESISHPVTRLRCTPPAGELAALINNFCNLKVHTVAAGKMTTPTKSMLMSQRNKLIHATFHTGCCGLNTKPVPGIIDVKCCCKSMIGQHLFVRFSPDKPGNIVAAVGEQMLEQTIVLPRLPERYNLLCCLAMKIDVTVGKNSFNPGKLWNKQFYNILFVPIVGDSNFFPVLRGYSFSVSEYSTISNPNNAARPRD